MSPFFICGHKTKNKKEFWNNNDYRWKILKLKLFIENSKEKRLKWNSYIIQKLKQK